MNEKTTKRKGPAVEWSRMNEVIVEGARELLLWQTWQLHAKLRLRLMKIDPQAVAMIDEMVREFYASNYHALEESNPQDVIRILAAGKKVIGEPLKDMDALTAMQMAISMQ